jgi:predicted nucleotidyltransferase
MKTLNEIKQILVKHRIDLSDRFGVAQIAIFGSYTKGKQKRRSDLDVLVNFKPTYKTFDNYMDLKFHLEDLLGVKIDLVTKDSLKEELKDSILTEALYV